MDTPYMERDLGRFRSGQSTAYSQPYLFKPPPSLFRSRRMREAKLLLFVLDNPHYNFQFQAAPYKHLSKKRQYYSRQITDVRSIESIMPSEERVLLGITMMIGKPQGPIGCSTFDVMVFNQDELFSNVTRLRNIPRHKSIPRPIEERIYPCQSSRMVLQPDEF
ncbi:hypothetical protein ABKN59_000903 [Abortiporus biennis]